MNLRIYQAVAEAYRNALDNGHNFDTMSPQEIAEDMQRCDSDLENVPFMAVLEAVTSVQNSRLLRG